jgi:hypothetical protein
MSKSLSKAEKEQAKEYLLAWLKPGDTVHCVLRHVSRSGMRRVIDLLYIQPKRADVQIYHAGFNAARAAGYPYDRERQGLVIDGCGMDMGFEAVYQLSRALFGDGYKLTHQWL